MEQLRIRRRSCSQLELVCNEIFTKRMRCNHRIMDLICTFKQYTVCMLLCMQYACYRQLRIYQHRRCQNTAKTSMQGN